MENPCIICTNSINNEAEICKTCLEFFKEKYPKKKDLEKILQWHKNQNQKLNEKD